MLPLRHLVFGILFGLILFAIFPQIGLTGFLLIVSSNVLIDIDHYLYYVYRKKDLNLKKAYSWYIDNGKKYWTLSKKQQKNVYFGICFLHGIEAMIILFLFFFYFKSPFYLFILTGFVFHQLLDLIEIIHDKVNPYRIISLMHSLFYAKKKIFVEDCKK